MTSLSIFDRAKYRAALEDIKVVNKMGLNVTFQSVIKKHDLHPATKASLIPNLARVDLDKEFDRLYERQAAFLTEIMERAKERNRGRYKEMRERIATLEKENERIRKELDNK